MKSERAYLKKLAKMEIGEDEFYEKERKFTKKKMVVKKPKNIKKDKWDEKEY
jgi:hypothetical protein